MRSLSSTTWPKSEESAYVMVNCEPGCENVVMEQLKPIEGVQEIQRTFGSYDILIKVETPTVEDLRDILTFKIRKIDNITYTTTLVCVERDSID